MSNFSAIEGKRGIWLLDLEITGRIYRFATEAVNVTDRNGLSYFYSAGLGDLDLSHVESQGLDYAQGVQIISEVDWAKLVSQGHILESQKAILRRWYEGQKLEEATVFLRGRTEFSEYGDPGRPDVLELSIARKLDQDGFMIPSPQGVMDDKTWPVRTSSAFILPENSKGRSYPFIIGYPGIMPSGDPEPATPAFNAEWFDGNVEFRALVSGHETEASRSGGAVTVYDLDPPNPLPGSQVRYESRNIFSTEDKLGTEISYFNNTASNLGDTAGKWGPGIKFGVGWSTHGGLLNPRTLKPFRGAGQLLIYLMEKYTDIDLDLARMEAEAVFFDPIKIDTHINERVNVYEWLTSQLVPLLGAVQRTSSQGIYWQYIRLDAKKQDATFSINTAHSGTRRNSSILYVTNDPINELTLDYGYNVLGKYIKRASFTSALKRLSRKDTTVKINDDRVYPDMLCTKSQAIYGVKSELIQSSLIWDEATAFEILRRRIRARALPKRSVQVSVQEKFSSLQLGSVGLFTDSELSITEEVVLLDDIQITANETLLTLLFIDHPGVK